MIKKINKYLLTHAPTVWGLRLVPMLLILVCSYLAFFLLAYLSGEKAQLTNYWSYGRGDSYGLLITFSILISFFLIVGWLIYFSRNNAISSLYPRKVNQIYGEWFCILVIISGMTFLPHAVELGTNLKWNSNINESEAKRDFALLNKVEILVPNYDYYYRFKQGVDTPIPIKETIYLDSLSDGELSDYEFRFDNAGNRVATDYIGSSFLFYRRYEINENPEYGSYRSIYNKRYALYNQQAEGVKTWMKNGQKDSLLWMLQDYEKLLNKHGASPIIMPQDWIELICNPPYFPVDTRMQSRLPDRNGMKYQVRTDDNYSQYSNLKSLYESFSANKDNDGLDRVGLYSSIYMALFITFFIFSFRVTGRKQWLKSFISVGILLFTFGLLTASMTIMGGHSWDGMVFFLGLCILTIIISTVISIRRIVEKEPKGKHGDAIFNVFLWSVTALIPLVHAIFTFTKWYDTSSTEFDFVYGINLIFIILIMYPICSLIKKHKGLAEE